VFTQIGGFARWAVFPIPRSVHHGENIHRPLRDADGLARWQRQPVVLDLWLVKAGNYPRRSPP